MESRKKFCFNCGTEIVGQFCHECGQKTDNYHRSLKKLFFHFLDEFFTFDSKFFRSLIPFLIKPGRLTNEYLSGKQVSYVAPFRLYFFMVVVFLFIQGIWNPYQVVNNNKAAQMNLKMGDALEIVEDEKEQKQKSPDNSNQDDSTNNEQIVEQKKQDKKTKKQSNDLISKIVSNAAGLDSDEEAQREFSRKFFQMIPNMLIVLMPFFALLLKLLNLRWKEFYYVDHFVFSLHFHAFGFFLLIILAPFQQYFQTGQYFMIGLLIYLYLALRRVYKRTRIRTAAKTFLLFISYGLLLSIGLVTVIVIEIINLKS